MNFEEFVIFDIFQKNDKIYLILSLDNYPISENDLHVVIDSKLELSKKYVKDCYEPSLIFIYDYKNTDKDILATISYKNITYNTIVHKILMEETKTLALTTLFKDDYQLFPVFYEYYKKQGVEHFYMYYNGLLTSEIKSIFNVPNVTLIEWNFRYFNSNKYKYVHHAQLGQIHDALYKYGKDLYEYMIFCDLDEYMHIQNTTIKNYIIDHYDIDNFGFCNHWSVTLDRKIPKNFPNEIKIGNKYSYENRSKSIYKTSSLKLLNIHYPHEYSIPNPKSILDLNMFHFYNWTRPNRSEDTYNLYTFIKSPKYCGADIRGGLGNKLFGLAQIIAFSEKHNYTPALNSSKIHNNFQTKTDWSYFRRGIPTLEYDYHQIREPGDSACFYIDYSHQIPPHSSNILFEGYFQSEKFFLQCKEKIYNQFRCPEEKVQEFLSLYPNIHNSYFLHVRRGDYVNNYFHDINLSKYFEKCLNNFDHNATFFVFSDDLEFCKTYQPFSNLPNKIYIDMNEIDSLWLMSLCKGGICSNSTFSWWGGWLLKQRDPSGIVYYPNKQFPHTQIKYQDLHPECFIIESVD